MEKRPIAETRQVSTEEGNDSTVSVSSVDRDDQLVGDAEKKQCISDVRRTKDEALVSESGLVDEESATQTGAPRTRSRHENEGDQDGDDADDDADEAPGILNDGIVGRVLSRMTTRSSVANPGPPPNGGWKAWLTVMCGHMVIMNTWGFINSFGIFQTYYTTSLSRPPSDISWIGSMQVFFLFFIGTLTGRLTDAGFFRPVLFTGSALQVIGIFSASFAKKYIHLFLAQGVCMGFGNGFLFCPCISVVSTYFSTKRSLAIGLVAVGSATGGIIFPVIARQMLPAYGIAWTLRTIGFVQLATLSVCNLVMRSRVKPRRGGPLVEWAAFKEPEYLFYAIAAVFAFWGLYFAFYYITSFATQALHPPLTYTQSLDILLILNGTSVVGRILPNFLADRLGIINVFIPVILLTALVSYSWLGVHTGTGLYAWAPFYSNMAGGIQGLFPAGLSILTTDPRKQGTRIGMVFTLVSFAVLTGPPIGGAIIQAQHGSYVGARIFAGTTLLTGGVLMIAVKIARMRRDGKGWRGKV